METELPLEIDSPYYLTSVDDRGTLFGPGWKEAGLGLTAVTKQIEQQEHALPWLRHGRD